MTDKSAAAIRELAKRIYGMMNPAFVADRKKDLDGIVNLLTALISEHYVSKDEHEAIAKMAEALKADMNAAKLELALMRKFILWTGENCQYYPDVNEWMYFESPMTQQYFKGTDELFNYWREGEQ